MQRISKDDASFALPNGTITQSVAYQAAAARLTIAGAIAFIVLLAVLHFIKPEFDPSWRFISEYGIGDYGWIMMLAFFSLALSCGALFVALRSDITTTGGKIGLVFLLITAAALIMAGIFDSDPITAGPEGATTHGTLHGIAATIGIPGLPIAAVLISKSLVRQSLWAGVRRSLLWSAHLIWLTLIALYIILAVTLIQNGGKFGPEVAIGWPNRLLVVTYCVWLITAASQALKLHAEERL